MPSRKRKEPPMLDLYFPEGGDVQPKGFSSIAIGRKFQAVIEGEIVSAAKNEYEWDKGKRFRGKISRCDLSVRATAKETADVLFPDMKAEKKK